VRGTKFDFKVSKRKTDIILFEGEVTYCPSSGDCKSVKGKCDVGSGQNSSAQIFSNGSSNHSTNDFTYVKSQRSLKNDFKISGAGECGGTVQQATNNQEQPKSEPPPDKPAAKPDPVPDPLPN
jgi:hypothetical protein